MGDVTADDDVGVARDRIGATSAGFGEASLELSDELSLLVRAGVDGFVVVETLVCGVYKYRRKNSHQTYGS